MLTNIEKYKFKPYNKRFPNYFRQEKQKLRKFLPKNIVIEHIGSTAVPGLGGKGIVDIFIGTKKSLNIIKIKLENNNYKFIPQSIKDNRLFFRKDYSYNNKTRRLHIHLVQYLSPEWNDVINFRDLLIDNPKLKKEYSEIKKKASKLANGNIKKYKAIKRNLIDNINK